MHIGAAKPVSRALAKAHGRRCRKRDTDDLFELRPVAMPADPRTRVIAREQDVGEILWRNPRKCRGSVAKRLKPVRNRLGGGEARILEVVPPAEGLRLAVPQPAVKPERRKIERVEPRDQFIMFGLRDEPGPILEPGDQRFGKQVSLAPEPNSSLSSDGRSSGASCSNVHCLGSLSGRQRKNPVPWRKRRPVTWS